MPSAKGSGITWYRPESSSHSTSSTRPARRPPGGTADTHAIWRCRRYRCRQAHRRSTESESDRNRGRHHEVDAGGTGMNRQSPHLRSLPTPVAHRPPFADSDASQRAAAPYALLHRRLAAEYGCAYRAQDMEVEPFGSGGCYRGVRGPGRIPPPVHETNDIDVAAPPEVARTAVESADPLRADHYRRRDGRGDGGGVLRAIDGGAQSGVHDVPAHDAHVRGRDGAVRRGSASRRDQCPTCGLSRLFIRAAGRCAEERCSTALFDDMAPS